MEDPQLHNGMVGCFLTLCAKINEISSPEKKNWFEKPEISKMRNIIIILPLKNGFFWHPVYLAAGSTKKKQDGTLPFFPPWFEFKIKDSNGTELVCQKYK